MELMQKILKSTSAQVQQTDEFVGMKVKDANKSKSAFDVSDTMDEFASGGIARMLGE